MESSRPVAADDRRRLQRAIASLSNADPRANRKRRQAKKAANVQREEALLNDTGIRALRRGRSSPPERLSTGR